MSKIWFYQPVTKFGINFSRYIKYDKKHQLMLENRYICFEIDLHEYYRNIPGLFLFPGNKKNYFGCTHEYQ